MVLYRAIEKMAKGLLFLITGLIVKMNNPTMCTMPQNLTQILILILVNENLLNIVQFV